MEVGDAIEALNAALRLQQRSALAYTHLAGTLVGFPFHGLAAEMSAFALAELDDARRLAEKITTLGGTPTVEVAPVEHRDGSEAMIRWMIDAETETIEALQERDPDHGAGGALGGARAPPRAHHHAQAGAGRRADPRRGRSLAVAPGARRPRPARSRSRPCASPASPPTSRRCAPRATCGCSSPARWSRGSGRRRRSSRSPTSSTSRRARRSSPACSARSSSSRSCRCRSSAARSPTATTAAACCSPTRWRSS